MIVLFQELSCQVQGNYNVCNNGTWFAFCFLVLLEEIYLSSHECVLDGAIILCMAAIITPMLSIIYITVLIG